MALRAACSKIKIKKIAHTWPGSRCLVWSLLSPGVEIYRRFFAPVGCSAPGPPSSSGKGNATFISNVVAIGSISRTIFRPGVGVASAECAPSEPSEPSGHQFLVYIPTRRSGNAPAAK